jgi:hypothetical protein
MTASAFDQETHSHMANLPKVTKRAAEQIAHLEAVRRRQLPPGNYLSFMGWGNDLEPDSPPGPVFGAYYFSDAEGVPQQFIVECHGVRVAFNIHDRLLAKLRSPVLDFDGERFVFVANDKLERD